MAKYDFFVSYSSKDKDKVDDIVKSLENGGAKCWYAPRDVVGRYAKAICDALENSKVFLLCMSKNSATSEHVLNEVEMAYNKRKQSGNSILIEPVCIEQLDLDSADFDEMMYYIRRINFIMPSETYSVNDIVKEVIVKNKDFIKMRTSATQKERDDSLYFCSERETRRLEIQNNLLKKFDFDTYQNVLATYHQPRVLDVGCSNALMITDRLNSLTQDYILVGVDKDESKIKEAQCNNQGKNVQFVVAGVDEEEFVDKIHSAMEQCGIDSFDVINISMLLLHIKSMCSLFRKLRRLLSDDGVIVIKDIDDGINFAYPDDAHDFERIYAICDNNETSGERKNGRQIYTNLYRAGFRNIKLVKQGFDTIGLSYEEKEAFWKMYFQFILGDIKWMHEKYPDNRDIAEDCEWYEENYERLFDEFMRDDFVFSLGFQIYLAKKN